MNCTPANFLFDNPYALPFIEYRKSFTDIYNSRKYDRTVFVLTSSLVTLQFPLA